MEAIAIRGVTKAYGAHVAVDDLTLSVPRGSIYGFIGPNGSGKSTTLRMITNIILPDRGEIEVLGHKETVAARDRVGYLPEERGLYKKMRVRPLLRYYGQLKGKPRAEIDREIDRWLQRMDLAAWADKKVDALSKGMAQKVQFIAAVVSKPELLILDEPFSGLDPVNQNLFKDVMLEQSREGATIIFSTHQMDTAERLCREIALIDRGRIVLGGSLASVKSRFGKNSVLVEYDGDGLSLQDLPGVARVDDYGQYREIRLLNGADPQALLRALVDKVTIRRFEIVEPTLHNIFIEQVGERPADA
jgi:ABC-2 type transport system ATP-binding protein